LAAFQEQTQRIDVGVKAIIHRAINENLSTIIEGVHLIPEKEDPEFQNKAIILQVLISTLDEENHRNRFISRGQDAVSRSSQKYLENFESIRKIQDALTARAKEYDVFIVDNVYFDETVSKIIQFLTRKIGELIDIDFSAYESTKEAGN
jgi:2-phosphoglycerate kinase